MGTLSDNPLDHKFHTKKKFIFSTIIFINMSKPIIQKLLSFLIYANLNCYKLPMKLKKLDF